MKIKTALILALALAIPTISYAAPSNVITDEDIIETDKENKTGGTYIYNAGQGYKIEGIKEPLTIYGLETAGTRMGHNAYLVNLRELAEKAKGSKMNFDMKEDGNKITISLGKDYTGKAYKTLDLKEYYRPDQLEWVDANLVVNGKDHPVELIKAYGEIYIRFKDAQNIIFNKGIADLKTLTIDALKEDIKAADYSVIYSYTYNEDFVSTIKNLHQIIKDNPYKARLIAINRDWSAYSLDELEVLLDIDKIDFPFYQAAYPEDDSTKFLDTYGYPVIVDKNMKVINKAPSDYYDQLVALFAEKEKISIEEYENEIYGKYDDKGKYEEIDKAFWETSYKHYLDYALGGKKVSLADVSLPKDSKAQRESILAQKKSLEEALKQNKIIIGSATFLLENTPQTIVKVKDKLINQLETAKELQKSAEELMKELDKELEKLS